MLQFPYIILEKQLSIQMQNNQQMHCFNCIIWNKVILMHAQRTLVDITV